MTATTNCAIVIHGKYDTRTDEMSPIVRDGKRFKTPNAFRLKASTGDQRTDWLQTQIDRLTRIQN